MNRLNDTTNHGEKAGVPYDGCLTKEDGKGWWEDGFFVQMIKRWKLG